MSVLSFEELLKLAAEAEGEYVNPHSHPQMFFKDYGVVENLDHRVDAALVYYHYCVWCKTNGLKPLAQKWFFRKQHGFPAWVQRSSFSGMMKYKLDKKSFQDSEEIREEIAKVWHRKRKQKRKQLSATKQSSQD